MQKELDVFMNKLSNQYNLLNKLEETVGKNKLRLLELKDEYYRLKIIIRDLNDWLDMKSIDNRITKIYLDIFKIERELDGNA